MWHKLTSGATDLVRVEFRRAGQAEMTLRCSVSGITQSFGLIILTR
mgnify:CR=1 FL=1|jgi:hypothetical protein